MIEIRIRARGPASPVYMRLSRDRGRLATATSGQTRIADSSNGPSSVLDGAFAAQRQAIDEQQDHRAEDGSDDTWTILPRVIPAERSTEEARHQRTRHAEQHGNHDAAGIFPWH